MVNKGDIKMMSTCLLQSKGSISGVTRESVNQKWRYKVVMVEIFVVNRPNFQTTLTYHSANHQVNTSII